MPLLKPSIQYERQTNIHRTKIGSLIGVIGDEKNNTFYAGMYYSLFIHPELKKNASAIIPLIGYEKHLMTSCLLLDIHMMFQ
ncbi:MAG: hypothetical protein IPP71_09970 [Bacteroidetes bacterium]|nr:hypothetical protein [Bacteroidota bacterium]